jgi:hypothetical protein
MGGIMDTFFQRLKNSGVPKLDLQQALLILFYLGTSALFIGCTQPGDIHLVFNQAGQSAQSSTSLDSPSHEINKNYFEFKIADKKAAYSKLKLFFIVDNSKSMAPMQENLAKSFDKLFLNENLDLLRKLNSQIYVINTAQFSSNYLSRKVTSELINSQTIKQTPYFDLMNFRYPNSEFFGSIGGDLAGFEGTYIGLNGGVEARIRPSFVKKIDPQNLETFDYLEFNQSTSITQLRADFLEKIKLLNPNNNNSTPAVTLTSKESGLCAISRILRDPEGLVATGDLVSFVLVSNENDSDFEGAGCVRTIQYDGSNVLKKEYVTQDNQTQTVLNQQDYILKRSAEVLGSSGFLFTGFVAKDEYEASRVEYSTIGIHYMDFANAIGGKIHSIFANDYTPALKDLSVDITTKILMSYEVSPMLDITKQGMSIHQVWIKKKSDSQWGMPVDSSQWTSSGAILNLNKTLAVSLDDQIRVEFY